MQAARRAHGDQNRRVGAGRNACHRGARMWSPPHRRARASATERVCRGNKHMSSNVVVVTGTGRSGVGLDGPARQARIPAAARGSSVTPSAVRRPRTNQTARTGSSPSFESRWGPTESKVIASPGPSMNSSKPMLTRSDPDQDVAPLLALVALERILRAGRPADLVGHEQEVDVAQRLGGQSLPHDAGAEPDARPRVGTLHGFVRQRVVRGLEVRTVVGIRRAPAAASMNSSSSSETPKLVGERIQRAHRRLGPTGLDLGDQARRRRRGAWPSCAG